MSTVYSCSVILGNLSTLETEELKNNIIHFLKSFNYDAKPEKVYEADGSSSYSYQLNIEYKHHSQLHVQRFSEALNAFCLFHRMAFYEHFLDS